MSSSQWSDGRGLYASFFEGRVRRGAEQEEQRREVGREEEREACVRASVTDGGGGPVASSLNESDWCFSLKGRGGRTVRPGWTETGRSTVRFPQGPDTEALVGSTAWTRTVDSSGVFNEVEVED